MSRDWKDTLLMPKDRIWNESRTYNKRTWI